MNRLQILLAAKANLATGAGQPHKQLAICFAIDRVTHDKPKEVRLIGNDIKDEVMAYLAPHMTFRAKLSGRPKQIQQARHQYIDDLIQKESK